MDFLPEFAPRLGIDARRRLIEQQQPGLVDHAGRAREPLLPAAGELAGELILTILKAEPREGGVDFLPALRDLIDAGDEFQIFADREIFPEAEALGHVADDAFDAVGLPDHIVAKTS